MTKLDPMIAVKDVQASANWYCDVFGFSETHGGDHFAILRDDGDVVLCLHAWDDEHPTMMNADITAGNGLLLYFRMRNWQDVRAKLEQMDWEIAEDVHQNPNSKQLEFSLRDPDGYYLTVTQQHDYEG